MEPSDTTAHCINKFDIDAINDNAEINDIHSADISDSSRVQTKNKYVNAETEEKESLTFYKYFPACCQHKCLSIYGILFLLSCASTIQVGNYATLET